MFTWRWMFLSFFCLAGLIVALPIPIPPATVPAAQRNATTSKKIYDEDYDGVFDEEGADFPEPLRAIAILQSVDASVFGVVRFTQSGTNSGVVLTGAVQGLAPGSMHGMHVHTLGDLSNGCESAGVHYNPDNTTHGAPNSLERHVGDLGNIGLASSSGVVDLHFIDYVISLEGPKSIIGRSLVVHADADDLGLGGDASSLLNGNSGAKIACGVIGYGTPPTKP